MASRRRKDKHNSKGGSKTRRHRRFRVLEFFGWQCLYCGRVLEWGNLDTATVLFGGRQRQGTVDHVLPVSLGGKSNLTNLVASCWGCNHKRSNLPIDVFILRVTGGVSEKLDALILRWKKAIQAGSGTRVPEKSLGGDENDDRRVDRTRV